MKRNVPISAIGNVSPVMTVERHEFRNRKTISTVSAAPSNRVRLTLATETRIERELSRLTSTLTPGGISGFAPSRAPCRGRRRPRSCSRPATSAPTAARCAGRCRAPGSRPPAARRRRRRPARAGPAGRRAAVTTMSRKSSGRFRRALIWTTRSWSRERIAPSGSSWFSLRTAATTWSTPMPSASSAAGFT